MKFETLRRRVTGVAKGSFQSMVWERPVKTKKAFSGQTLVKRSTGVVRFGIVYDNMKAVQEKRSSGELPAENAGLQWGEWMMFPYFIKHKGNVYLRCAVSKGNAIQTEYFLNGVKVSKESVLHMMLASEMKSTSELDVFSVNIENIIAVG